MTTIEIQERITEIKLNADDDEHAHGLEDKLHVDFIKHVREVTGRFKQPTETFTSRVFGLWLCEVEALSKQAELVLLTEEIDFARWCA